MNRLASVLKTNESYVGKCQRYRSLNDDGHVNRHVSFADVPSSSSEESRKKKFTPASARKFIVTKVEEPLV
jgi:hypothetical protein